MPLKATTTGAEPDLLFMPWDTALEDWPADATIALPRGISRHTVRFVRLNGKVYAVKEIEQSYAIGEYGLLRDLKRLGAPCVEPIGVISGRADRDGEPLPAALITRHLSFSLPYRSLASQSLTRETADRLLDALVLLIVRLHLLGFAWNDCSLSNTLFRRDAGAFSAYLVDAETGEIHPSLSRGQRAYDLETAAMNVTGELLDLEAGGLLADVLDPVLVGEELARRYEHLWMTLTEPFTICGNDRYQIQTLLRTLNGLGFDVAEMTTQAVAGGEKIVVTPKVVDAGHHRKRMMRLTGLEMQENQARRLLNDLDAYRLEMGATEEDEQILAHMWVSEVYEPILMAIPRDFRAKFEPPELVHEVLQHRWFSSERAGRDIGLASATQDYIDNVLRHKPDEAAILGPPVSEAMDEASEDDVDQRGDG